MRSGILFACVATWVPLFAYAASGTENAQLPFTPYSSTYLPKVFGPLNLKVKPDGNEPLYGDERVTMTLREILRPEVIRQMTSEASTFDRLERLRSTVLGKTDLITQQIADLKPQTNLEPWRGVCHQWTAASLNGNVDRLLEDVGPLLCGSTFIAPGEVEELVTGLYADELIQASETYGLKTSILLVDPKPRDQIQTLLGIDDLAPSVFHEQIYKHLRAGQGIAMDRDPSRQAWNQPIYKASTAFKDLTAKEALSDYPAKIPVNLLELSLPDDSEAKQLLESLLQIRKELFLSANALDSPTFTPQDRDRGAVQMIQFNSLLPKLKQFAANGRIRLQAGVKARASTTTLTYGSEDDFFGEDLKKHHGQMTVRYVELEKAGAPTDSFWVSPESERPDYLWVPAALSLEKILEMARQPGASAKLQAMGDLIELTRKCPSGKKLLALATAIVAARKDNVISEPERAHLRAMRAELGDSVISESAFKKALETGISAPLNARVPEE